MENLKNLGLVEPFVDTSSLGSSHTRDLPRHASASSTESEEFGLHRGLDLIPGRVRRIPDNVIVPHMGWNQLKLKKQDPLLEGIEPGSFVYFVHSYYADPKFADVTLATTDHGIDFAAIVHQDNLWATQFHPEKSQKVGERLLDNFGRL